MIGAWAPTSDLTLGRGSDPALFPWMGVHSLGSVYSEPEWWVIHPWLGLDAIWVRMCGQVYLHIRLISYELMCGRATTARVATAFQYD